MFVLIKERQIIVCDELPTKPKPDHHDADEDWGLSDDLKDLLDDYD